VQFLNFKYFPRHWPRSFPGMEVQSGRRRPPAAEEGKRNEKTKTEKNTEGEEEVFLFLCLLLPPPAKLGGGARGTKSDMQETDRHTARTTCIALIPCGGTSNKKRAGLSA